VEHFAHAGRREPRLAEHRRDRRGDDRGGAATTPFWSRDQLDFFDETRFRGKAVAVHRGPSRLDVTPPTPFGK